MLMHLMLELQPLLEALSALRNLDVVVTETLPSLSNAMPRATPGWRKPGRPC